MKKLLIACFAILAIVVFISDAAFAQRGDGARMGHVGGGHVGGMAHAGGGMGHGPGMRAGGFAGRGGPIVHNRGVAIGPRSVAPVGRAAFVGGRAFYGGHRFVAPGGGVHGGGLPLARHAPTYARPGAAGFHAGSHYPRHRHRGRGFVYYYGGWWYAYPWWNSYYGSYYDDCSYWDRRCAWRWGYGTRKYYGCMRYHNCY